jgi:hypothetical protein
MPNWTDDNGVSHFMEGKEKKPNEVFVFGSNRQGRHGKGAAYHAKLHYGAIQGQPSGRQGNSYAIITKELRTGWPPVTLSEVAYQIGFFVGYALEHLDETFILTKIGCGLAGFKEDDIKPFFAIVPPNVKKPEGW